MKHVLIHCWNIDKRYVNVNVNVKVNVKGRQTSLEGAYTSCPQHVDVASPLLFVYSFEIDGMTAVEKKLKIH